MMLKNSKKLLASQDWEAAIELYSGEFLKDFYDSSCNVEAWLELERESLKEAYELAVLRHAQVLEQANRFEEAAQLLIKALPENPFNETMVQAYMNSAYLAGKRKQALEVFESFQMRLKDELDTFPLVETLKLAQRIRENKHINVTSEHELSPSLSTTSLSSLAKTKQVIPEKPFNHFVARAQALNSLKNHWVKASSSKGQIVLIHGEAGTGKTALIETFCQSLQQDAFILKGHCSSYLSLGDPYLAFQDIFTDVLRIVADDENLLQNNY